MAKLRLVPPSGDPIEITSEPVVVGRDPSCDILLNDGSVSRKHAVISRRGTAWVVVDQGSANGTFLDSQRVADTVLRQGQELRFGAVAFRIEIEAGGPETTLLPQPEATVVQAAVSPPPPPPRPAAPTPPLPSPPPPRATPAAPPRPPRPPGAAPRIPPPPAVPPAAAGAPPLGAAPAKKGKGPIFWIATGCCGCLALGVLVVALFVGGAFVLSAEPVKAVRTQLTEIKEGRIDAAYAELSASYQAQMSREEFEAFVAQHPSLRENSDSTFFSRSVTGDTAKLAGYLVSASGSKEAVSYELVKEAGTWKIANISFVN